MSKTDHVYLTHILQSIDQIFHYSSGMNETEFLQNQLVKDAVVRNFEVIGEATKQLSKKFRNENPQIEWKKMAGMRDKLIHDYLDVDYEIVWMTIKDILPRLKKEISKIIDDNAA